MSQQIAKGSLRLLERGELMTAYISSAVLDKQKLCASSVKISVALYN